MRRRRFGVAVNPHAIVDVADELVVMTSRTQLGPHIGGRGRGGRRGRGNNRGLLRRRTCGDGGRWRSGRGVRPGLL